MKKTFSTSQLFTLSVFLFFCVFFIQIHPIIPHDTDDWNYLSQWRLAVPSLDYWNPTRVMPETLMPFFSGIAAFLVYPLSGDYLTSMIVTHGIVVSLFATLYIRSFLHVVHRRLQVDELGSIALATLFLIFHFLIFRSEDSGNQHLFYSHDLTCYYNYTIPNLLCATVVMYLIEKDWVRNPVSLSPQAIGWRALIFYYALFSHLYGSCILGIFLGCNLLLGILRDYPIMKDAGKLFKKYRWMIITICAWLTANLLEIIGSRAELLAQQNENITWSDNFLNTLRSLHEMTGYLNRFFVFLALVFLVFGLFEFFVKKEHRFLHMNLWLMFAILLAYVVLLTSNVKPYFMLLSDVVFSISFPLLLLTMLGAVYLYKHSKLFVCLFPIVLIIVFSGINTAAQTFRTVTCSPNLDEAKIMSINKELLSQMVKADECLLDSVVVIVPDMSTQLNWPYSDGSYLFMSRTLYKHGVIKHLRPGLFVRGEKVENY